MTRPLHGRRAKRAQWLHDAEALDIVNNEDLEAGCQIGEHAARVLCRESAARRERRLARMK